jgi:outer membrane protein OmpA-like peptidoglycan-associated protein
LAEAAIENNATLINRKYESLYVTNGMDNDFEGDVSMTVEDGENVTVGMALRKCLDQFYADLKLVLSLDENSIIVYGKVTSSKTGEGLGATISFRSDSPLAIVSTPDGKYQLVISKTKYNVQIVASGFMNYTEDFDAQASHTKMEEINFKLQPIETGRVVALKNVLFQVGTTKLLNESFPELDDVVTFLKGNRKVKIELQGHTDNQGNAAKDLELSQQRVDVIKAYLVNKGISSGRIKGKGFGSSKPIASNASEEGRKLNRRVEFVILKK